MTNNNALYCSFADIQRAPSSAIKKLEEVEAEHGLVLMGGTYERNVQVIRKYSCMSSALMGCGLTSWSSIASMHNSVSRHISGVRVCLRPSSRTHRTSRSIMTYTLGRIWNH